MSVGENYQLQVRPSREQRLRVLPLGVQLRHRAEVPARDHGAILEPEVEQVAIDDEPVPEIRYRVEEAVKRGCDRRRDLAEMSVGDDHDTGGWQGHGPQASAVPTIHANGSEPVSGLASPSGTVAGFGASQLERH